jgi:Cof subfamily protein (haloacid dehalogenase superfamily)
MTKIRLLISDVDGTLVTRDKRLTPASVAAVQALRAQGIQFSITSSRPPFGMRMLCEPLGLDLPIGPFNGSSLVMPDMTVLEQATIPPRAAAASVALFARNGIDVWLFTNSQWLIQRDDGRYVPHEQKTIATAPTRLAADEALPDGICKIVGVSGDFDLLARCETELQALLGGDAHAARSQNYYLDVTPPGRDKGAFITAMGERLGIAREAIATIGDMSNDLPMFAASGLSFAMGNAADPIKAKATHVTASNEDDGFARAVETILALGF